MTPAELWRSSAFRSALSYGLIIATFVAATFGAIYIELVRELDERLKVRTAAIIDTYTAIDRANGADVLVKSLNNLTETARKPDRIYLVTTAEGRFVAGNIKPVERFDGWKAIERSDFVSDYNWSDDETTFVASWATLSSGDLLLVGLSDHDVEEAREELIEGFLVGLLAIVVVTLLTGAWFARKNHLRILAIGQALDKVATGSVGLRVPVQGRNDDLDLVGEQINDTLDRLDAMMGSLRQISAGIAHELKTPISRLKQHLDEVSGSQATVKQFRQATLQALVQVDEIIGTFDALLRISQIEAGTRKNSFKPVSLNDLVENVVEIYVPVAEDAGHRLIAGLPDDDLRISGDRELLTQLLVNLVENAIRHCPEPAEISVNASPAPGGPVVMVSDNGPGIPADEREKVMTRLYKLDNGRMAEGAGLGLSLVKAVADLHGAALSMDDNRPGLIVRVEFPENLVWPQPDVG